MSPTFTFRRLHDETPSLSGPERLRFFHALPTALQTEAWAALRERFDFVAERGRQDDA